MTVTYKNLTENVTGLVGVNPRIVFLNTDGTLSELTTAGFIYYDAKPTDVVLAAYSDGVGLFKVAINDNVITLSQDASEVELPTIANDFATFADTEGTIKDGTGTATYRGNINAGKSGTAGALRSYASTATTGKSEFKHTANSADYTTTYTNAAMGQDTTITTPDPGTSTAKNLIGRGSIPAFHLLQTFDANGTLFDAGVYGTAANKAASNAAAPNVVSVTPVTGMTAKVAVFTDENGTVSQGSAGFSAKTATGAGGSATFTITDSTVVSTNIIVGNFSSQANAVSVVRITPGTGNFEVQASADPGAWAFRYISVLTQ